MAGEKWLRVGVVALLVAIGCYFIAQPAFYPANWIRDLLTGFVPLLLAGYLLGPFSAKSIYAGIAVVVAAVALSFAWVFLATPLWPGFVHIPFFGTRPDYSSYFPPGTDLFSVGLRLAPEVALRAAVLFFTGVAARRLVATSQTAAAR